jgi:hypothetical protein
MGVTLPLGLTLASRPERGRPSKSKRLSPGATARRIRNYDAQPFAVYLSAGKLPDFALLYPADQPRSHSS